MFHVFVSSYLQIECCHEITLSFKTTVSLRACTTKVLKTTVAFSAFHANANAWECNNIQNFPKMRWFYLVILSVTCQIFVALIEMLPKKLDLNKIQQIKKRYSRKVERENESDEKASHSVYIQHSTPLSKTSNILFTGNYLNSPKYGKIT